MDNQLLESLDRSLTPRAWVSQAWTIVLLFILVTVALIMGAPQLLRFAFPLGSFAVAGWLFFRAPLFYVGFTWWLWFVTPFITRIVDYRTSFDELRLIQVSSFLAVLWAFLTVVKELPKLIRQGGMPFVLIWIAIAYGTCIGLVKTSPVSVARGMLDWFVPALWGFYLFTKWRDYAELRQIIQKAFLWGVLVMGSYGIYQYLVAPEWDRFWITSTALVSVGKPEPYGIRVWSTMASPGPFAIAMMAGLMLLFSGNGLLRLPAAAVGFLSFLLSLVRSAWGGWFVAMVTFMFSLRSRLQIRFILTLVIIALCVVPLTTIEPFASTINSRLQTVTDLGSDRSAIERQDIYAERLSEALLNYLGNGVGNTFVTTKEGQIVKAVIDSGVLDFFFTLGWFGGMFYLGGLLMILYELFLPLQVDDPFMVVARAISVGCLATLPYGSGMLASDGMILWGFIGISMAAQKYHRSHR
jgi:hypothetical protein